MFVFRVYAMPKSARRKDLVKKVDALRKRGGKKIRLKSGKTRKIERRDAKGREIKQARKRVLKSPTVSTIQLCIPMEHSPRLRKVNVQHPLVTCCKQCLIKT